MTQHRVPVDHHNTKVNGQGIQQKPKWENVNVNNKDIITQISHHTTGTPLTKKEMTVEVRPEGWKYRGR